MQFTSTPISHKLDWFKRYAFQVGLVLILAMWTPLLVSHTLSIQHSSHPLISGGVSPQTPPKNKTDNPSKKEDDSSKRGGHSGKKDRKKEPNSNALPIGLAIGLVGAGIGVIFGAPILVVTGIGAAVSIVSSYIASSR